MPRAKKSTKSTTSRGGERKQSAKLKPQDWTLGLKVVHPKAAGIDVGNEEHWVAVPPSLDAEPVRRFKCFTRDLEAMADWLVSLGIETVAETEAHFVSFLDLSPKNKISGGKVVGRDKRKKKNRAGLALQWAAGTLLNSDTYLGAQYRRFRTKLGAPKARKAMANKLARLVYRLLKYGEAYVDQGREFYQQRYQQQQIRMLSKKAAALGMQLVPCA